MTTLLFSGSSGIASVVLDAAAELRIVGAALSIDGPVIAWFRAGRWWVGRHPFDEVNCDGSVTVELEGTSVRRSFGPFDGFRLKAELACTRRGVLARYHAVRETWYFDRQGSQAESMIVRVVA